MTIVEHAPHFGYSPAVEFVFPLNLGEVPPQVAAVAEQWGANLESAASALKLRFSTISSREVRAFTCLFDGLVPCSLLVQDEHTWIVMKKGDQLHEPTVQGNALLLPTQNVNASSANGALAAHLVEFLDHFGGLTLMVPPAGVFCGSIPREAARLTHMPPSDLGGWHSAVGMFYPGNGDIFIARPDGAAAVWQHELDPLNEEEISLSHAGTEIRKNVALLLQDLLGDVQPPPQRSVNSVRDLHCDITTEIFRELTSVLNHEASRK